MVNFLTYMKRFLGILLFFLSLQPSNAQGFLQNVVSEEEIDELCSGNQSQPADQEAELVVDQIMAQMQLKRAFKLRKCTAIGNAYATIQPDANNNQTPYILYDPQWLEEMANKSKTDWASIGVLAHEVGHFLLYHALNKKGSNPVWEIQADRFAGSTLAKMGSTLEEAQSMFDNYNQKEDSRSHPGKAKRLEAVKVGWMNVNNPQKQITLSENTPERDVSSELIVNRYFNELGGIKNLSQIKSLRFEEEISETKGLDLNQKPLTYSYSYTLNPNKVIINSNKKDQQYVITNNDSISWRYTNENKWREGAPRIGTTANQDGHSFIRQISPSFQNFFDDFLLSSNPEVVDYRRRRVLDEEECFLLEFPEETIELGDLRKKGRRIIQKTQYYFNTYTGLLHAIVIEEKIMTYKRGSIKDASEGLRIQRLFSNYKAVDNILFPHTISTTETKLLSDIPQEESTFFQKRKLVNLEIITD